MVSILVAGMGIAPRERFTSSLNDAVSCNFCEHKIAERQRCLFTKAPQVAILKQTIPGALIWRLGEKSAVKSLAHFFFFFRRASRLQTQVKYMYNERNAS